MENNAPKKPIRKIEPGVRRVSATKITNNYSGFFLRLKVSQVALDHKKLRYLAAARKISSATTSKSDVEKMLDAVGLVSGQISSLKYEADIEMKVKRHGSESFTIFASHFFDNNDVKVGDIVEVHFPIANKTYDRIQLKVVKPGQRSTDFEFGEIISQTFKHLKDPIWQVGSELIEKALRVTNPEDPTFYGSSSGSLNFWSYRSYNAREEIYIQWRWNSVGELYVEAVSNKYAWPKISVDGINHLLDSGWSGPRDDSDEDLPNFFRTYEDVDVKKVAHHLMKVLRDVYLVKRDWIWLFNPFYLVEKLFEGKSEDDFRFKPEAFFIFDEKQTYKRRCEMGVQLSKDVLPPKWLRPWMS